ncbi:MAG: RDD family protein [Deltaproteobacteria bacterium]|nr:RDD family protein [Deltaproteobacteria bacterium]
MTTYKFAGFWRRFVAYTIDGFIVSVVFIILAVISGIAFFTGAMSGKPSVWISQMNDPQYLGSIGIAIAGFYTLLFIAYFTYFQGLGGRTPGKKLLGLQVVSVDGRPISFGVAFLRSVGYLVSSLLFTIPLGYIWAAFDKRKQAWHDKIAGTVVIIRETDENTAGISIPDDAAQAPGSVHVSGTNTDASLREAQKPQAPSPQETTQADGQKIP